MTISNISGPGNYSNFILILTITLLSFSLNSYSQRLIQTEQYSAEYFDSIRLLVNHTIEENYTINAYRLRTIDTIIIDGRLNESVWMNAERSVGFLESEPYPLVPMSEETEFAVLYDDENLYVGVWCWDSEPEKIIRRLAPRGNQGPDNITLFIDSFHDQRTGFKFVVSPTGVQADELRYDDIRRDVNWNGVWYSAGSIDENGWYAEFKIPFFNFRYSNDSDQTWGILVQRFISKDASRGQWKPHLPEWGVTTRMSQLGDLKNITNISSGRTLEVRPYGVAGSTQAIGIDPSATISVGADLRYSPSPNLTADFTINPDFAQVDADVFEINLTRFPTRFQELRPFFTERTVIFNTPLELFYSRRIGAMGDILGGAKMTAKLKHGIELGMLGNITGKSFLSSSVIDPESAQYGVFRVKKDILGSSSIGILAATKEGQDNYNRVLGLDGSIMLNDNNIFNFQVASGQNELDYDNNMAYNLTYTRTGDLVRLQFNLDRVEPAFEINRIGYIRKEPDRGWNKVGGQIRVSPRINKHHIRRIIMNLNIEHVTDIFTSRYIDRWLTRYPTFIPDHIFGSVAQSIDGERYIEGGVRNSNNITLGGDMTVNLLNEMSFTTEYRRLAATELTGNYAGDFFTLSYLTRSHRRGPRFSGMFSVGGGTFYNFDQKYPGSQLNLAVDSEGWISNKVLTGLQGGLTRTYDNMSDHDGQYYKLSSNTVFMFTKDFYFRLHAQGIFGTTYYDQRKTYNEYLLSCLLSWEYRPGSFLYLAYNEGRFDESNPTIARYMNFSDRTVVLKISYFFNV
jgi:hypothetical protein